MFSSRKDSMQSKQLANTFRIVQAFVCSVPLILINIVTLINALKVETPESEMHADLHKLANHMGSGKDKKNREKSKYPLLSHSHLDREIRLIQRLALIGY